MIKARIEECERRKEVEKLQAKVFKARELQEKSESIGSLAAIKHSLNIQIGEMEIMLEDLHHQFDKLMPEQCPLCGRSK